MDDLIHLAIPAFIALMVVEACAGAWVARQTYAARDTAASLAMGVGNVLIALATKGLKLGLFFWLYDRRLLDAGTGAAAWVGLFFADDFVYYWYHRKSHEVRLLWAAHVNHHSSRRYNLSTALRQSWTGPFTHLPFYAVLPLLGFHPLMVLTMGSVSLLYQFWIHTEHVGRLPRWLEAVFNTPSHHRVHHGSNVEYLDRNHGGILIVWDRLFGTFEPEDEDEPVVYGLTQNIDTFNPVRIASHEYEEMLADVARSRTWRERLEFVLRGPRWAYRRRAEIVAEPEPEPAARIAS